MKRTLLVLAMLLFPSLSLAQTTTVTATITDSDTQTWNNGSVIITFVPSPNSSGPYYIDGVLMTDAQKGPFNVALNGGGTFTKALTDNNHISPAGTMWLFTLCPNASAVCSPISLPVTGTSVNLSTTFSSKVTAPRFPAKGPGLSWGYGTFEISQTPVPGGSFFDVTQQCIQVWSGSAFSCSAIPANFLGVLYVGGPNAAAWGGGDIGSQINAAYTSLPATGGKIGILSQANGACYNFSTPILLNTQGKYVIVEGISGTSNAVGDVDSGACMDYTPNTNTVAMTLGWGPIGGGGYSPGGGLRDITLKANGGCFIPGGCGNAATGILTTNGGVPQGFFRNVKIEGFATGWNYGDNSDGWGVQWVQFHLVNNTVGATVTSTLGEEKLFWDGGSCSVNATCFNSAQPATDLYIHGVSIDSNTVNGIVNGGTITCVSCHFENLSTLNAGGTANVQYITSGNAVTLIGGLVLNDNVSASPVGQFFSTTTGFFSMYGTSVYSPNQVITSILNNTSAGGGNINVTTISPSNITAICSSIQNCFGGIQAGNNPSQQIPVLKLPEGPSVTGAGNYTVCGANSSTHQLECNYDLSGTRRMPQVIQNGVAVLGTTAIASGACATTITVAATGVNINDVLTWVPNGSLDTLSGYGPFGLVINAFPSANNVNFDVCNPTAGSLTPHSLQLNWAVNR